MAQEDRNAAFVKFKPDFIVALLWPQLEYIRFMFFEEDPLGLRMLGVHKIGGMTEVVGIVDIDHVLYFKLARKRSLFKFLEAFDSQIWTSLVFLFFAILFSTFKRKIGFCRWIFMSLSSLLSFSTDIQKFRSNLHGIQTSLFLVWMTFCFLLQSLFGGDMFAHLALEPKSLILDSLEDLHQSNVRIKTVDVAMLDGSRDTSNTSFSYQFEAFGDRVEFFTMEEVFNPQLIVENFWEPRTRTGDVSTCNVGPKAMMDYFQSTFQGGRFRDILHVSKEGGDAQTHSFSWLLTADKKERWAMDHV